MIDNPEQVERLLGKLDEHLPFEAALSPALTDLIRKEAPGASVPRQCQVTWVSYTGDEGGIICQLDLGGEDGSEVFLTSITHLIVRPGMPLAREIAAYQKHRIKRLRRGHGELYPDG
jgi:hypothetical protein